jgi:hypothetical protein
MPMGPLAETRVGHPTPDTPAQKHTEALDLKHTRKAEQKIFKWKKGDCLANYNASAQAWAAHTTTPEFATAFTAVSDLYQHSNDLREAKIEEFLLREATNAGVVEVKTTHRAFANPNKWNKHLAPWYNTQCRAAKRAFHQARQTHGKHHATSQKTLKQFVQRCKQSRADLQFKLPEMLKNRPQQFWGMLKSKTSTPTGISIKEFTDFN